MQTLEERLDAIEVGINEVALVLQTAAFNHKLSEVVLPLGASIQTLLDQVEILEKQVQTLKLAHELEI